MYMGTQKGVYKFEMCLKIHIGVCWNLHLVKLLGYGKCVFRVFFFFNTWKTCLGYFYEDDIFKYRWSPMECTLPLKMTGFSFTEWRIKFHVGRCSNMDNYLGGKSVQVLQVLPVLLRFYNNFFFLISAFNLFFFMVLQCWLTTSIL